MGSSPANQASGGFGLKPSWQTMLSDASAAAAPDVRHPSTPFRLTSASGRTSTERSAARIIHQFHNLYYASCGQTWENTFWRGVKAAKFPTDLWIYQEILVERKPDLIVETGTYMGGSALFLADMCELVGNGRVVSIDINPREDFPRHPRIEYVAGSSTDPQVVAEIHRRASGRVMVILDSDHSQQHVFAELDAYHDLVTPGDYLIVEDTNVGPHNEFIGVKSGALQALQRWIPAHPEFESDRSREKLMLTANPLGYLRRKP